VALGVSGLAGLLRGWAVMCQDVRLWGVMYTTIRTLHDSFPSSARPCHSLALRRLSRRMSSGTLVRASSEFLSCLCVLLVVTRSRGSVPVFSAFLARGWVRRAYRLCCRSVF
jgi:hypothetical protein